MERVQVEWLIIGDAAQVVGGKLYLLGGGWDVVTVNAPFPYEQRIAIAASFRVPWNSTNQVHFIEIRIENEDGNVVGKLDGQFEMGRPPGIPPGQDQRTQLAVDMGLRVEAPGTYVVVASVDREESSRTHFNVVQGQTPVVRPP